MIRRCRATAPLIILAPIFLASCDLLGKRSACELGLGLAGGDQRVEAITALNQCLTVENLDLAVRRKALYARAYERNGQGDSSGAAADLDAAFQLQLPARFDEFINAALIYRKAGRSRDSLSMAKSAVEGDDGKYAGSMMAQYHLGWALQANGEHRAAIEAFDKAVPAQPDFPYVYWRRAISREALGELSLARADLGLASPLFITGNSATTPNAMLVDVLETYKRFHLPAPTALERK